MLLTGIFRIIIGRGQFFKRTAKLCHIVQGLQWNGADDGRTAPFAHLHNGQGFYVAHFGKGIFERCSAIAYLFGAAFLRGVDMTEGNVIKDLEYIGFHVIRAAHGFFLGIATGSARYKLMGEQDITYGRIHVHGVHGGSYGIGIRYDFFFFKIAAHVSGLDEGEHINVDGAIGVLHNEGCDLAVIDGRKMDATRVHNARTEGNSFGRIVIAADDEYLQGFFGKLCQKIVEEHNGFGRRNGFIVNITRNQNTVGHFHINDAENLIQDRFLFFQHGKFIDTFSEMQVG